jgi:exonuclease III
MVGSAFRTGGNTQTKDCVKNWRSSKLHHLNTQQHRFYNLEVYHENVRGLKGKLSLLSQFLDSELAHIVCITEHHLKDQDMDLAQIEHYKLGAKFCRQQYKNGGTSIFVHESLNDDIITTDHICKEKNIEICTIKLNLYQTNIVIIVIYRSPSGNYG